MYDLPPLLPDHGGCLICGPLASWADCQQHASETGHEVTWTKGRTYQG